MGKPLLRLLDCYLLDCIQQLDDEQRAGLVRLEPKLQAVFGMNGRWNEILCAVLDLPDTFPEQVRAHWQGYLDHAHGLGRSVHPNEFVLDFTRQNFAEVVSG
ncbi:hypothetical protein [Roseateles noduli]|uniref:hypothetical protein n=1 Tax=Roseateles noduli TaxID=2052484 RepID=UPI003D65A559